MNQLSIFDREILPLFEEHRQPWVDIARAAALRLAEGGREVTIDDVRAVCPPPPGVDPRVNGAVFKGKGWRLIRHKRSERRACHNRPVAVWVWSA